MSRRRVPTDPNGPHARVYHAVLNSPAWRCLGWSARALYIDLRATVNSYNNGNVAATMTDLRHRGWNSSATLAQALYELRALGFIAVTRAGGLRQGARVPNLYRFTDLPVYDQLKVGVLACDASHDYKQFESVAAAQSARESGLAQLRADGRRKHVSVKVPVQILKRSGSDSESMRAISSSENEHGAIPSLQKMNKGILQ